MSPEQLSGVSVDRRTDVFAAGVVLWEALTGERLFTGEDVSDVLTKILRDPVPPPSSVNPKVRREVDQVVMHALDKSPETRFQTAREFAVAVEEAMELMSPRAVGEWVEQIAGESLAKRERALAEIESISSVNELSMTPSDPGFMRTLKTQIQGKAVGLRHSRPGAPPLMRTPKRPSPAQEDDAATTIYHGPGKSVDPPPLPDGAFRSSSAAPSHPPAVIIADLPPDGPAGPNLFRTDPKWRPYLVWAGGGMLAVSIVYFLVSLFTSSDDEVKAETVIAETKPDPPSEKEAVDPSELPIVRDPELGANGAPELPPPGESEAIKSAETRRGSESQGSIDDKSAARSGSKPKGGVPKKKSPCAQPWYVDGEGIRRIKAECL
jgi:serine/threonine-protein kinase